jgi:hypothetical protein
MWNKIIQAFERAGRARAAAELARMGRHEDARRIIAGEQI